MYGNTQPATPRRLPFCGTRQSGANVVGRGFKLPLLVMDQERKRGPEDMLAKTMLASAYRSAKRLRDAATLARQLYENAEQQAKDAESEANQMAKRLRGFLDEDDAPPGGWETTNNEVELNKDPSPESDVFMEFPKETKEEGEARMLKMHEEALEKTLNGFPLELEPHYNPQFEELLKNQTLMLSPPASGLRTHQIIVPGAKGKRNDIFDNKELFKDVVPRFYWSPERVWERIAPKGW